MFAPRTATGYEKIVIESLGVGFIAFLVWMAWFGYTATKEQERQARLYRACKDGWFMACDRDMPNYKCQILWSDAPRICTTRD